MILSFINDNHCINSNHFIRLTSHDIYPAALIEDGYSLHAQEITRDGNYKELELRACG